MPGSGFKSVPGCGVKNKLKAWLVIGEEDERRSIHKTIGALREKLPGVLWNAAVGGASAAQQGVWQAYYWHTPHQVPEHASQKTQYLLSTPATATAPNHTACAHMLAVNGIGTHMHTCTHAPAHMHC